MYLSLCVYVSIMCLALLSHLAHLLGWITCSCILYLSWGLCVCTPSLYLCVSVCLFVRVTPALLAFYDLNQDTDTSTESTRLESCGLFRGVLALVCVLSVSVCLCLFWDS